jgi:hypothetical protein
MPISVHYGGTPALQPPAPEDEDTIIAALKHSDRVTSIRLTVPRSLLKKLSSIKGPFSKLENLVLVSQGGARLALPSAFQWGPRLRSFQATRIAFPSLLQLLDSSKNLVDLHLHEDLSPFPLRALTSVLSRMVQLRSLSLHFLSDVIHLTVPPPPGELAVLPALTRLNFLGRTDYLEGLVSRIDAPLLGDIKVTFLNTSSFDLLELRKFTDRIGTHDSHHRADILASELAISVSLTRPGDPTCLTFELFCKSLSEQLFFVARICNQFSAFFSNVEELLISVARHSRQEDRFDSGRWPENLNSFTGVKWFCVVGNLRVSTDIVRALQPSDTRRETVLPALYKLYIPQPAPCHAPFTVAVESFIVSRRLSGHPISVEYERRGTGTVYDQSQDHYLLSIFDQEL